MLLAFSKYVIAIPSIIGYYAAICIAYWTISYAIVVPLWGKSLKQSQKLITISEQQLSSRIGELGKMMGNELFGRVSEIIATRKIEEINSSPVNLPRQIDNYMKFIRATDKMMEGFKEDKELYEGYSNLYSELLNDFECIDGHLMGVKAYN